MISRGRLRSGRGVAALAVLCGLALAAQAQDGGLRASLDLSQRLSWSDNNSSGIPADPGIRGQTNLRFGLVSETRTQSFAFDVGAGLLIGPGSVVVLPYTPSANLSYSRENRDTRLSFDLGYAQADVSSLTLADLTPDDPADGSVLIVDTGTRTNLSANIGFEFGREAPFGGSLTYAHSQRSYIGTTDPSLEDLRTDRLSGELRFDIDPRITARLTASTARTDYATSADVRTDSLGVAADFAVNPATTATVRISHDRIERGTVTDGFSYGLSAVRVLTNGAVSVSFDSTLREAGRRDTLNLKRDMELRNGRLNFSAGLTRSASGGGVQPIFGLGLTKELPRAVVSVNIGQVINTDSSGADVLTSSFGLGYQQGLTDASSLAANLSLRNIDVLTPAGVDGARVDLTLSYRHELARDWGLVGGYTHTLSRSTARADVTSNTIFLSLEKRFDWRP